MTEEYSTAQPPEYSTLPEHDEMSKVPNCKHIRMASRNNQRIIMLNRGSNDKGFVVCRDCGAAVPNTKKEPLKGVERPHRSNYAKCRHADTVNVASELSVLLEQMRTLLRSIRFSNTPSLMR